MAPRPDGNSRSRRARTALRRPHGGAERHSVPYSGVVMEGAGQGYTPPRVRDYGDLLALTKADATMLHVGIGGVGTNGSSSPVPPPGGGTTPHSTTRGDTPLGDTLPATS